MRKDKNVWPELELLTLVRPHAIITTNFDTLLETVFEGYEPIIGQSVIRYNMNSFGEIFKIHGTCTDAPSLVLTTTDYDQFASKKKYVSAKLLTYLAEHPVFIFGYSFGDPNVTSIIGDLGAIVADEDGLIPNVFYVQWDPDADKKSLPETYVINSESGQYRVNAIVASEFDWIFKALANDQELKSINTKLVRALAARAYKLIRTDIPKGTVTVDYATLEKVADSDEELPALLGITQATNSNMTHPLVLTQVANKLGYDNWNPASKLINKVKADTGIDSRSSDNQYHCQIKTGLKGVTRKWSQSAVELLTLVRDGKKYNVKL